MEKRKLPELLAPAGDTEAFYAALSAGADAVYLGLSDFNARVYAKNFDAESLTFCVQYAHLLGRRVYVTMNTLLYDKEKEAFLEAASVAVRAGVDAAIVADLGAARLLRRHYPRLPLHASTQMTVTSAAACRALRTLGFTRVVPARELSLRDIQTLTAKSGLETEIFLHGALCVSYSGQCLMSAMIGGRSGNRGACAQPCRLPYNGGYPLSLRDLSLAGHIEALLKSGVSSLKIEGRMKSAGYVYHTVSLYRRLLDEGRSATPAEWAEARRVFSRGGFTDGYFAGKKTDGMTGVRSDAEKEASRSLPPFPNKRKDLPLTLRFTARSGAPASLSLAYGRESVTVEGETPAPAEKQPLTAATAREQLRKLGGTPFVLSEDSDFSVEDGIYLSLPALNCLRRIGVSALLSRFSRPLCEVGTPPLDEGGKNADAVLSGLALDEGGKNAEAMPSRSTDQDECKQLNCKSEYTFSAYCYDPRQLAALPPACESYLPLERLSEAERTPVGVALPPVLFDSEEDEVLSMLRAARSRGVTHALCGSLAGIACATAAGLLPVGDFRLNICNREARAFYRENGILDTILSPELLPAQCRPIGGRAVVYGRLPLMLLERCFIREGFGCEHCNRAALTDRRGASFPLLRVYPHRNMLLNSLPTYMGDRREALRGLMPHFIFTTETPDEVKFVLSAYEKGEALPYPVRRMGRSEPRREDAAPVGSAASPQNEKKVLSLRKQVRQDRPAYRGKQKGKRR